MNKADFDLIRRYHRGELSPREMYELEYRAEHDPMLMDILLGMEHEHLMGTEASFPDIQKRISQRIHPKNKTSFLNWKAWTIAATVVLCLSIGGYFLFSPVVQEQLNTHDSLADKTLSKPSAPESTKSMDSYLNHIQSDSTSLLADATTNYPKIQEGIRRNSRSPKEIDSEKTRSLPSPSTLRGPRKINSLDSSMYLRGRSNNRLANKSVTNETVQSDLLSDITTNNTALNPSMKLITGKVVDNSTREPLMGATLKVKNSKDAAVTDSTGDFRLASSTSNPLVEVRAMGYQTQHVPTNILANGRVKLKPENIIIRGSSPTHNNPLRKEIKFGKAQPIMGWSAYNDYVEEATKQLVYKASGAVTLSFKIDEVGTPINIKVKSSDNSTLDQRAVEIIKNGPKWKATMNNPSEIILFTVDFQSY